MAKGKSCLNCAKFITCTDPKKVKVQGYSCEKWKRIKEHPVNVELIPTQEVDTPVSTSFLGYAEPADTGELVVGGAPDDFIAEAMRRAYDPDTGTIRDLRVDDSQLKMGKNFFDFCLNIVGKTVKMPFARQMWTAFQVLAEFCPRCTKPKWYDDINNIPVDMDTRDLRKKVAFLEFGVCPYCEATRQELIAAGELNDRTELVMICGQRAGKSTLICMLIAYITHVYLKSPKLSTLYEGIQDFTPLSALLTATTSGQALKTLWSPFRRIVAASSWYSELFEILDSYADKKGSELYQFNGSTGMYLRFFHKNLELASSGPMSKTLRGDTRYVTATDELGLFPMRIGSDDDDDASDNERERANADEVHQTLSTSLTTVQNAIVSIREAGINHFPQAINFNISSPYSWVDKICRLYLENADNPSVLCVKQSTWDMSPLYTRNSPIIVAAYKRNAKKAERDFGANPPKIGADFYEENAIVRCFTLEPWYAVTYQASNEYTLAHAVQKYKALQYPPSVLALDAGSDNNAFALTLTYRDKGEVYVPLVIEVVPSGHTINFPYLYEHVILPICKMCNVKALVADRWGSLQLLQQAKDDVKDLKVAQYSVKMADFDNMVNLVSAQAIYFPKLELPVDQIKITTNYKVQLRDYPASHLLLQCLTVQELGGTVTKGASASMKYTDDLHRAATLGVAAVLSDKVSAHLAKFKLVDRVVDPNRKGIVVSGMSTFVPGSLGGRGYGGGRGIY